MKIAKSVFSVLFLVLFGALAIWNLTFNLTDLLSAAASGFPSPNGMAEAANYTALHSFPGRTELLEGHARLQLFLGKRESGGLDVIATDDGAFVSGRQSNWQGYTLESYARKLRDLQQTLEENGSGAKVMFISTQPQIVNGYTQVGAGVDLTGNASMVEGLLYYLRGYHIDFVDTSGILNQSSLEASEYIYRTDSRWTTQACFVIMQTIEGKLADSYALDIPMDLWDKARYNFDLHENIFLGGMGMSAGEPFTGREDFTAISPAYDTSFTYEAQGSNAFTATGSFEETLFNETVLDSYLPYLYNSYSSYLDGGLYWQRKITNHYKPDGAKILFIHDASALPLAALLAPAFGETHMYNPRLAPDAATFDLTAYIEENNIDLVFFQPEADIDSMGALFSIIR